MQRLQAVILLQRNVRTVPEKRSLLTKWGDGARNCLVDRTTERLRAPRPADGQQPVEMCRRKERQRPELGSEVKPIRRLGPLIKVYHLAPIRGYCAPEHIR
jgi:hypothetical protein